MCVCYLQAFTGDTLFIGSCGRPDLVGAVGHSAKEMSERMYHSLKNKVCTLPDDVKVRINIVNIIIIMCDEHFVYTGVSCTWCWLSLW